MLGARDLRFFGILAGQPSLAAAARALDVTPPAVSQRLAQIEARLGLRLVERGVGPLCLTEEGELLARRAVRILGDLDNLIEDLATRRSSVSGLLRVVASFGFGRLYVAPIMASLSNRHEGLEIDLRLTEDPRSALPTESWDVLIHVGRLPDTAVIQRKLAANRRILCAAPDYVSRHSPPLHPSDLSGHACGVIREDQVDATRWSFAGSDGEETVRIRPSFSSNDGEVVRAWALAGLGIVERSEWSIARDLAKGRLVEVMPDWRLDDADVVALLNPHRLRAARVQSFIEALAASLAKEPWRMVHVPSNRSAESGSGPVS
ncbi:DNA-binding transcriptional LysR family regulator [Palleronia aestuarii]|uniref:DNA-binding transcriptional LysR family regulator n=1 Tax=Palleronia aestuarii TaxID=568105 RepID=A0A2W7N465_9RHOB|nr:LysR family transcriptional regulator [Palleronia aestuarii]PZX14880.1 DNA-binding transcriptional LysR family regulator [Palleronia aestuarii]